MWHVLERICLGVNFVDFCSSFLGKCIPRYTFLRNERALRGKKSVLELGTDCCERNLFHIKLLKRIF